MEIRIIKARTKPIGDFNDREWRIADKEHFGGTPKWKSIVRRVVLYDGNKIIGSSKVDIMAGVCQINTFNIAHDRQGQGLGKQLMAAVEDFAQKNGAHKLWLNTGKGWKAEAFYKKLGFKKFADMKKHFFGRDFVLYERFLKSTE